MTYIDANNQVRRRAGLIKLHGEDGFEGMRRAGQLTARALDLLVDAVKPGVTTRQLDQLVFAFAREHGAFPATLLYRGYRYSICTSIDYVVCHGMPEDKPLREGEILNVDVTLIVDGWHGDASRMYAVGAIKPYAERLINVTYEALLRGIAAIRPGGSTRDIAVAIQTFAETERFSVVEDFCGHGIGRLFHDEPNILHYATPRPRGRAFGQPEAPRFHDLKPGMFFTVEPMINLGRPEVRVLSDGWTAITKDRKLSAQFEHTVAVTETGVEVFTLSPAGLDNPLIARAGAAPA
jgi:methionyl aminopeptidase